MLICSRCGKGKNIVSFSRHKKGSSGAGGTWALRAPIHKRVQRPNLHVFKGQKYCTKCLRATKKDILKKRPVKQQGAESAAAI